MNALEKVPPSSPNSSVQVSDLGLEKPSENQPLIQETRDTMEILVQTNKMSAEQKDLLETVLSGETQFSVTNGFLSDLLETLKEIKRCDTVLVLHRFEMQSEAYDAQIDSAKASRDGAIAGFAVSCLSTGASFYALRNGNSQSSKGVKGGDDDQQRGPAMMQAINLLGQGLNQLVTSTHNYEAQEEQAISDWLRAALNETEFNQLPSSDIRITQIF